MRTGLASEHGSFSLATSIGNEGWGLETDILTCMERKENLPIDEGICRRINGAGFEPAIAVIYGFINTLNTAYIMGMHA